jgi:hypothetical protein
MFILLRNMSGSKKINEENTKTVSINTDGNCLFRSLVSFVSKELFTCKRNRSGVPSNRSLQSKEINLANSLRFFVVNYIERNKEKYTDELSYDSEYYDNIDDRIKNMLKPGEFGGILEINVASEILKIGINIYVLNDDYNLVYNVGEYPQVCKLLLDEDHYELLKPIEEGTENSEVDTVKSKSNAKLVVTNSFVPKFKDDNVKCIPFSMTCKKTFKEQKDGIYIYDKNNKYGKQLKNLGEGCSKKLDEGWFIWDNVPYLKQWADDNEILWLY